MIQGCGAKDKLASAKILLDDQIATPNRSKSYLERETGIEPVTLSLGKLGFLPDRLPE